MSAAKVGSIPNGSISMLTMIRFWNTRILLCDGLKHVQYILVLPIGYLDRARLATYRYVCLAALTLTEACSLS
jgi:hypothetical protein